MLYDVIIVGGGVSGLSAGYALSHNKHRFLVIERGKHIFERQRNNVFDIANGVGGAGLFSDGKISMYPSATNLWGLRKDELHKAYDEVKVLLGRVGVEIDDFIEDWTRGIKENGLQKRYESKTMNIEQRMKLIFLSSQVIGKDNILVDSNVTKIEKADDYYNVSIVNNKEMVVHQAKALVFSGGKHSFQKLIENSNGIVYEKDNYVLEVGFRIECPNDIFDYFDNPQTDVKLITEENGISIRTFCCCRDGIILESSSYGMHSLNGSSSDWQKTGYTNIGILVKIEGDKGKNLRKVLDKVFFKQEKKEVKLIDYLNGGIMILGSDMDDLVRNFLKEHFPKMSKGISTLIFPSIEKDGFYPYLNDNLQYLSEDIWVVGDATGLFRGLTPSLVSGVFAGNSISSRIQIYDNNLQERFHIKVSNTIERKVVFTAQSKQYFYCRDAVCEFVLRQGCIPVNPFRLFDYFLGDRVDRGLIRNGNNEMIKRCDELWVFGNVSDGVLFEIVMCRQMGKVVRFFNIDNRANQIHELKTEEITFEPEIHARQIKKEDLLSLVVDKKILSPGIQLKFNLE